MLVIPIIGNYKSGKLVNGNSIGQIYKQQSDIMMDVTWDNDIQSKKCYIYDYYHDDQPKLKDHMTYDDYTSKTPIDAKFIVTKYGSLSKDQVEFHILFRPSQKVEFEESDDLYYYEKNYHKRFGADFPIGMYIDIPNERGIYEKWIICAIDPGNQFIKYSVLQCNYKLQWIEINKNHRIKREMWSILRTQQSYTSGTWRDYTFSSPDNVNKIWIPMNDITQNIFYVHEDSNENQRFIISTPIKTPLTWKLTKIENAQPFGLQKMTIKQDQFNPHTDFVDYDINSPTFGDMYADYYDLNIIPENSSSIVINKIECKMTTYNNFIKIGGSYRLITLNFVSRQNNDMDELYKCDLKNLYCAIQTDINTWEDITKNEDLIKWLYSDEPNKVKIKFLGNRDYMAKVLKIYYEDIKNNVYGETKLEITV